MPKLKLTTFQIGAPVRPNTGLRIGTTRLPPRGVPKSRWKTGGYFDVWLPTVAPSRGLLRWIKERDIGDPAIRRAFFQKYEREILANSDARHTVQLLAELARRTRISIGCFCVDESLCHRSHLRKLIERFAAA